MDGNGYANKVQNSHSASSWEGEDATKKPGETTRAMEQSQDESYLTIPQCPWCKGNLIYIEDVLMHKC